MSRSFSASSVYRTETFSPRAYGFDFYGDNLCTSAAQVSDHPDRTRAFLAASLKGWDYALNHKEEIVDLIVDHYSRQKTRDALLFEAVQSEILIEPGLIPLGEQTPQRWQSIANTYHDLGILSSVRLPNGLIYREDGNRLAGGLGAVVAGANDRRIGSRSGFFTSASGAILR